MAVSRTILLLALLSAGCAARDDRVASAVPSPAASPPVPRADRVAPGGWRALVLPADRTRLRTWRDAWVAGLAGARKVAAGKVAAEGVLLAPDAALADPAPPPGRYRCRVTKLGAARPGLLDHVAYPPFNCRIDALAGGVLRFTKLDGSQRPAGLFYPEDDRHMVFLGAMVLGDERRALDYGRDTQRDMAGLVERVGPARWRLVLPWPRWESKLDVMELVPA